MSMGDHEILVLIIYNTITEMYNRIKEYTPTIYMSIFMYNNPS